MKIRTTHWLTRRSAVAWLALGIACGGTRESTADPLIIAEWVHTLYGAIRVERLSPPVASRVSAYAASALYAGFAAADDRLAPLGGILKQLPPLPAPVVGETYDAATIAIASGRVVLDSLFATGLPTTRSALARLADSLAETRGRAGVAADVRARSDALGRQIGEVIAAWTTTDGFAKTRRPYAPPVGAGFWKNDAPAALFSTQNMSGVSEYVALDNPTNAQRPSNMSDRGLIMNRPKSEANGALPAVNMAGATEPYWGELRPFTLTAWNACAVAPPPMYSTDTASALYRNAKVVYDTKGTLTDEQKTIALYWADNAGESGTPVGHWLSIASQMISERALDVPDAITVVLATALSQGDAFIAAWGYKYQYSLIRPRMYIRRVLDATWEPQIPTPPFPEHPAGHSTQSSAAATVMTALLGATPFRDSTSVSLGHSVRAFPNFIAASEEAGMSRIYGGIHFPTGNEAGLSLGRCIGDQVIATIRAAQSDAAQSGAAAPPTPVRP